MPSQGYAETRDRDRAILCLPVYACLRAQEVSTLNVGHYNGVEVNIVLAKHGSVGLVPVDAETNAVLVDYLMMRWIETQENLGPDDPLFVSYSNQNQGQHLSYEGIYKIVKDLAKSAGLEDIHPHRGRHTFISDMVENGVDAYLAMKLSRQRSLKSYQTYSEKVRYQAAKAACWKGQGKRDGKRSLWKSCWRCFLQALSRGNALALFKFHRLSMSRWWR